MNTYAHQFRNLVSHTGSSVHVLPKSSRELGIHNTAIMLRTAYFDSRKCAEGIEHLQRYKRKWNERMAMWMPEPLHDTHSDAADAARYVSESLKLNLTKSPTTAYEKHKQALKRRKQFW